MNNEKAEEIVLEFGHFRISQILSDDIKVAMEEEKSFGRKSKYKGITNFFSSPLEQQVLLSKHGEIPSIMFLCIEQIQIRGITEEGIFRIPGTHSKIQKTRKLLQDGKRVDFNEIDILTVASILKLWLRELPTPLIPFSQYSKLIALGGTVTKVTEKEKTVCMDKVKRVILSIPKSEYNCLRALMTFLHNVALKGEVNKMHAKNLAIVIAPNIMYRKPDEVDVKNALAAIRLSQEMAPTIEIITILIQEVEFFFFKKDKHVGKRSE